MRQTGRTSRIIDFAIDQLFSVGEVIITDHTAFEYPGITQSKIQLFIDRVKREMEFRSLGRIKLESKIDKAFGRLVVHFKLNLQD